MIETIEALEKKGFRISINPSKLDKWVWRAGVYVGDDTKAIWIPNLQKCHYPTYKEAFDAVVDFCSTYKPKQRVIKSKK